tara:strand:+ start:69 stop:494 length:426 start_codon:yes stop_codon:yes gene_type:complete
MAKLIYSRNGSETTESIDNASPQVRWIWKQSHRFGANIVRVRAEELRYGKSTGKTFDAFHHGKVSVYKQKDQVHQDDALYFARKIPLTKVNKGMQILEIHTNIDVQGTLDTITGIKYYAESTFFERLWNRIRYGTPMSITA